MVSVMLGCSMAVLLAEALLCRCLPWHELGAVLAGHDATDVFGQSWDR